MINVVRADQAEADVRQGIAEIFAEGFTQWLGFFSKDPKRIAAAFSHIFVLNQFYVALYKGQVVGMAACTDGTSLSVKLDKKELRKHLGLYKGTLAGIFLKKEFETNSVRPSPGVGSIEFVGTASKFRGQGVASQLIRKIFELTPHKVYLIEEVADSNIPAMKLYYKLGFEEYKRRQIPVKRAKKIGINYVVSLRYIK
ncbi:GNAT family N-acetyltransferase [Paenibacillus ihbetae]|uniref:GNAT family N-acetyltransferase n=1 Tax=Paenibacillus ihbetae TaxID=1870820 RepID=A0A1B2E433_9BACL|nr:GNAT family N-acetyltransferase [Paenibacillus ihbetae]ANY74657.1 GNAT family N-acetyltransferase [Paenibacillus ihbetae]OOC63170.1 GNAT family N-acetyltransferase [Paenibacillus ihbetae]